METKPEKSEIPDDSNFLKEEENGKSKTNFNQNVKPITFTDLLGTYRITLSRIYIPILISIFLATFFSWLTTYQANIQVNVAIFPEEKTTSEILLNGLIPVLISAVFITVLWLLIKRFGMKVFKFLMGILVTFYTWYGIIFFGSVLYTIAWVNWHDKYALIINIIYEITFYGSAILLLIAGIQFFRDKLNSNQKNLFVLSYSIFMGSIFGISFPLWSTFAFAIFLSIWDLITVFKGPLGKIANLLQEGQERAQMDLKSKIERGEITEEEAQEFEMFSSLQTNEFEEGDLKNHLSEIKIELGSGDLILYSALVACVFINTLNWVITGMVILGIALGVVSTLYFLLKKKKMLPALPFSMVFGIIMYFIGQLILLIF